MNTAQELSTIGGGCFWCLEAIYEQLEGVISVESGYSGGNRPNPTYEEVCSGTTGHAEVVQITFEPDLVTYKELLWIFFSIHDPTTLDRQGADVGSQYRSAIFPHDVKQNSIAKQVISEIGEADMFGQPVVTQVSFITEFYMADEAFICGSGLEVAPILSIDRYPLGKGEVGQLTLAIRNSYLRVTRGEIPQYRHWLTTS
mgnify:CR=1 FL=1